MVNRIILITLSLVGFYNVFAQSIEYYFWNMPDSVMQICDWRDTSKYSMHKGGVKILDSKNGFLAFKRHEDEVDFFQMALFKGEEGERFIMVRNQACEHCCCESPKTFFYSVKGKQWSNAMEDHFPKLSPAHFVTDREIADSLIKIGGYYRFKPEIPRYGTKMIVNFKICEDYIVTDGMMSDKLYQKLLKSIRSRQLVWNKYFNAFQLQ